MPANLRNGIREYKIEQALTFKSSPLITMPLAVEVEKRKFAQAQQQLAVIDVAGLVAEARQAYYTALAAESPCVTCVKSGRPPGGAELAWRAWRWWAFQQLRQTREQAFCADAA